jgi:hypothetical protein
LRLASLLVGHKRTVGEAEMKAQHSEQLGAVLVGVAEGRDGLFLA